MDYKQLSGDLTSLLGLKRPAVGIKLIKGEYIPEGWEREGKLTFCQFIMKAREGARLIADAENISCPNGASALGFMEVPEKLKSGEFLEKIGVFEKDGGREMVESVPRFELGEYSRVALAPLSEIVYEPDLIFIETLPEHVMWLNLASIYTGGGRLEFSTSVSNGTCSDLTVVPTKTGRINVSAGCYGCRNATDVPEEHMYASFPGSMLEGIIEALKNLEKKAMPRTRQKKAYNSLIKA